MFIKPDSFFDKHPRFKHQVDIYALQSIHRIKDAIEAIKSQFYNCMSNPAIASHSQAKPVLEADLKLCLDTLTAKLAVPVAECNVAALSVASKLSSKLSEIDARQPELAKKRPQIEAQFGHEMWHENENKMKDHVDQWYEKIMGRPDEFQHSEMSIIQLGEYQNLDDTRFIKNDDKEDEFKLVPVQYMSGAVKTPLKPGMMPDYTLHAEDYVIDGLQESCWLSSFNKSTNDAWIACLSYELDRCIGIGLVFDLGHVLDFGLLNSPFISLGLVLGLFITLDPIIGLISDHVIRLFFAIRFILGLLISIVVVLDLLVKLGFAFGFNSSRFNHNYTVNTRSCTAEKTPDGYGKMIMKTLTRDSVQVVFPWLSKPVVYVNGNKKGSLQHTIKSTTCSGGCAFTDRFIMGNDTGIYYLSGTNLVYCTWASLSMLDFNTCSIFQKDIIDFDLTSNSYVCITTRNTLTKDCVDMSDIKSNACYRHLTTIGIVGSHAVCVATMTEDESVILAYDMNGVFESSMTIQVTNSKDGICYIRPAGVTLGYAAFIAVERHRYVHLVAIDSFGKLSVRSRVEMPSKYPSITCVTAYADEGQFIVGGNRWIKKISVKM